jgi:hypothetical protein
MPHNPGGTVSKADLSAANLSFATASAAYETSETNYNRAESDFFALENTLITRDNQLFEAQSSLDKLRSSGAPEELLEEAQTDLDEAQDNRDSAFLAFRAKDVVVRQSESIFFSTERTYYSEQDHLFQVQDQYNFQVSELRESTGVQTGIQNNFDQYLFTGRDSATDATNRTNAQTRLTNQNTKLATQELELDGFNRALSFVSEDWEGVWIRAGRVSAPEFNSKTLEVRRDGLKTGQEQIDTPVDAAHKSINEIWVAKTGVITLWGQYSLAFDTFNLNNTIFRNNPGQIEELQSTLSNLEREKDKLNARIVELGGPFKKGAKIPEEADIINIRLREIDSNIITIKESITKLQLQLDEAQALFNKHGADFGTDYVAKLNLYKNKIKEAELLIVGIERSISLKEGDITSLKEEIVATESEIEQYEAILRPKEDALAITEIFVEQIAGAITAGGDSETKVIKAAKVKGQAAGENITAADALSFSRSFNWSMKQIKSKITEAANKGETSIIVEALSPATVSVLNDMGYNMRLIGIEKTVISGGIGDQRREIAVDQKVEISWLFAREASIEDYTG